MKIKFVDLNAQYISIKNEVDIAIQNVISESSFIKGKHVASFENNFKKLFGVSNCISVANGTDSLFIIMKMLGIGKGDEVITSAYSWISSSGTISLTGAKPIFIDIEKDYFTIDPNLIESKINANTKAIMVVHIHGQACDMDKICKISEKYNLPIIEDCAQAHLAEYNGKLVGTFGIAASFSFFPGKNLGAYGDAGGIITNDIDLAKKCRMFANNGQLIKHHHEIEGINSRMDGLQAAILNVKLKYIREWTNLRRKNAKYFCELLKNVKQIKIPKIRNNTYHSFHLFVVKAKKRDLLKQYLEKNNISVAIHYPKALPNVQCYKSSLSNEKFAISSQNEKEILSLPLYPELKKSQMKYIAQTIINFYEKK